MVQYTVKVKAHILYIGYAEGLDIMFKLEMKLEDIGVNSEKTNHNNWFKKKN